MPSFLRGLFETKNVPRNAVPRAVSNSRGGLYSGVVPNMERWDIDQALNQSYERVIWVYRCIDAIASNSSYVPMILREYNDVDGMQVEDKQLMRLLNRRPNSYETSQQFRYRIATQALLSRRGVFIEVVRDRSDRPKELHLLPNSATEPIPDPETFVSGYKVQTLTQGEVILPPERVIWLRVKPHPTDVYAQMTPLVSAGLASDTDFFARLYNRNFLANDGRPGMLVAVQGQLMPEDAEEIRRRFSGGPSVAGQTTVIEAEGISATDMASNPRDVQWQEAVRGSKEDILLAFGVPESVLGNASGRTFDNADAEFEIFWQVTMQPFMDAIAAGYDILTAEGLRDNIYVAHDYSTVDVLQRQERRRHEKAMDEYRAGLLTIDQYLEIVGREKFDVPGTRTLWIPQGSVPIGRNDNDTDFASALQPVGMGQEPDIQQEAFRGASMGAAAGQRQFGNIQAARALRLAGKQSDPLVEMSDDDIVDAEVIEDTPELESKDEVVEVIEFKELTDPFEATRIRIEAEIGAAINAWSRRQERAVVERIGGTKARKGTRHWEGQPGTKAIDAVYVVNPEQWADDLVQDIEPLMKAIGEREALKAARQLDKSGVLDRLEQDGKLSRGRTALDRMLDGSKFGRETFLNENLEPVKAMIRKSALRQSERIIEVITQMDADGASVEEIKREIQKMIGSRSSWKRGLSIAAATAIMEGSRAAVHERAGRYVKRIWRTMRDEKVRPSHRRAFGQKRSATNPFRVGTARLMYPGDPTGPIEETANCRCWVEVEIVSGR